MPRRKQTQPMQRKNSEDREDKEDVLSETDVNEEFIDNSLTNDLSSLECSAPSGGLFNSCYSFIDRDTSRILLAEAPEVVSPIENETHDLEPGPSASLDTDFDRKAQSPDVGWSPLKKNPCPDYFPDTSQDAEHMEIEDEKENQRLSRVKIEKQFDLDRSLSLNQSDTKLMTMPCLASGDEISQDGEKDYPRRPTPGACSYVKDLHESSSASLAGSRIMDVLPVPGLVPDSLLPNTSRQSSVKQLESFVASVEYQSQSNRPKTAEKKTTPSVVPMLPVTAALSRKCKSSRLKTTTTSHSLNLPKMSKQPVDPVCQYTTVQHQQQQQQQQQQQAPPPQRPAPLHSSDPNQPLDLSVRARQKDTPSNETKYLSYSCIQDVGSVPVIGGSGSGSSLADLEKKFGNASAIFDRIGTKTWSSPFCGALVSRLGVNLYNSKLHGGVFGATDSSPSSSFGVGMIPVPVQRYNSNPAAPPKPEAALPTKSEHVDPVTEPDVNSRGGDASYQWHQKHATEVCSDQRKHTNFQCSCGAELETLYHLTMHIQQTGHAPNMLKNAGRQEYSKLVRGQDMWLNHGCEQTRQILRCMECDESFKSLPELTVHMIQTKHYANIVGADAIQRKVPSKNSENRSEPSSEGSEASRIHCHVCLEPFDDAESLGSHILEAGHYKTSAERTEKLETLKESSCAPGRNKRNSRSMTPVDPASPQSDNEDTRMSDASPAVKNAPDRKRCHSLSENSPFRDPRSPESVKRCRSVRYSDSEDGLSKAYHEGNVPERESEPPSSAMFLEPISDSVKHTSSENFKRKLESPPGSPAENDSLSASIDDSSFKPQFHKRSGTPGSDSVKSCRPTEEIAEPVKQTAFHPESFFRSSSNSSSDGSAIRAMETFIKNSFAASESRHHRPAAVSQASNAGSVGTVGSLMSRLAYHVDGLQLGHPACGRQEPKPGECLDNSSLYQNKYLPPVYISSAMNSTPAAESFSQLLPTMTRKLKSESDDTREPDRPSLDSESQSRDSEDSGREFEGPASSTDREGKAKRHWLHVDEAASPVQFKEKSETFLFNLKSNKLLDLKAAERTKGGRDIGDPENDDRPSSTSNNNNNNNLSRSSALESLQGLVYGKTLNSEHPLDSLQKLIYGRGSGAGIVNPSSSRQTTASAGHLLNGANGSSHAQTAVIMKGSEALHHPLPPGTLILVNPIVTVVPGASGSNPSLSITLPGCESSPPQTSAMSDECASTKHGDAGRRGHSPHDDRENSLRVYRCRGCRRKFSSKGSYRYHLSRCHVLTSSSSSSSDKCPPLVKDPLRKSPYICLPLDATSKFNKYYKLASELGAEAK